MLRKGDVNVESLCARQTEWKRKNGERGCDGQDLDHPTEGKEEAKRRREGTEIETEKESEVEDQSQGLVPNQRKGKGDPGPVQKKGDVTIIKRKIKEGLVHLRENTHHHHRRDIPAERKRQRTFLSLLFLFCRARLRLVEPPLCLRRSQEKSNFLLDQKSNMVATIIYY